MFSNLKLKSKMLIGYAIPTVIFLGISGLVYSTARQVSQTFQAVERVQTLVANGIGHYSNEGRYPKTERGCIESKGDRLRSFQFQVMNLALLQCSFDMAHK